MLKTTYDDARYIRREIQINGEEFFYIYIYITIYANSYEGLEKDIQKIEGVASGVGLTTRRGIYRQKDVFCACLPFMQNQSDIKGIARRNVLTSGIVSTYPFISNEICDENGVLIGVNESNQSFVMIDRFESMKYKNANMCIIGTSGSGKSYFTKLMVARHRYMGIEQYVIDPEGEYIKLCQKLSGSTICFDENNTINIMDIRKNSAEREYLRNKITKLNTFFSIIFPNLTEEEKCVLEEKIVECYKEKNITFDDNSLYKKVISR